MEDVVRIGLPLGECVGLQHRQSWLRFPPNTDEEVHSCWAPGQGNKFQLNKHLARLRHKISVMKSKERSQKRSGTNFDHSNLSEKASGQFLRERANNTN